MKRLTYKCRFLTDVVLNAHTATEGNSSTLDYVPGSNFLGILANELYGTDENIDEYTLFHSGKVRFIDAHPLYNEERALRVPLAWFYPKGGSLEEQCVLMHLNRENSNILKNIQPKQAREGFFTSDGQLLLVDKNFALKSAYDRENRKSSDGQMFGYESLPKNSEWVFHVDIDDGALENLIDEHLTGKKRLGRSRSAQYGQIQIERIDKDVDKVPSQFSGKKGDDVTVYAAAPLTFFNEYGLPRFEVTAEDFGLKGNVCLERCQLRTRQYSPWNGKRKSRDADRLVIDKGSVIVVQLTEDCTSDKMQQGVGAFRNEGLGQIIFNPGFLEGDKEGKLQELKLKSKVVITGNQKFDDLADNGKLSSEEKVLTLFLKDAVTKDESRHRNYDLINNFIQKHGRKFKEISNSQWGNIRHKAFAAGENKDALWRDLFGQGDKTGYLTHGEMAEIWVKSGGRKELEVFIKKDEVTPFTVEMLAQEIVKHNR